MTWLWAVLGTIALAAVARFAVRSEISKVPPAANEPEEQTPAAVPLVAADETLRGIPEIRHFFRTNETPVYFVSATAFNLLGIDRWVRNFRFVNYYDSFDGWHPNVIVPKEQTPRAFESIEEIVNYLLGHKEIGDLVRSRGGGKAAFLMFDEETEELAADLGLDVAFPPASLRHRMDSKIETTRLGNEAGVPSVPNVMGSGTDYKGLLDLADGAGLGHDLVVQTPYGDSGQTTFFIADEDDWKEHRRKIEGEDIKVMKRIEPRELAIEGVITRHGTLVGPLMAELTGFPELTPYDGGWCGNDVSPELLTEKQRRIARERTVAMGERLRQEGYRGYFELDYLLDADTGEMWLGELNPRVTGASSITNVTAVAYGDMPLFLFHLLEFMDVDYEIDVDELNERWAQSHNLDEWTQFILKQTEDVTEMITAAPSSGIWRQQHGGALTYARRDTDWHTIADESEAFYLRIAGVGQYRYPGADLGIMVTRGRFMNDEHELLDRARDWITGIKGQFASVPPGEEAPPIAKPEPFGFKMLYTMGGDAAPRDRLILEPDPSVDPEVGRWLAAMEDARRDTLTELEGVTPAMIDARPPGSENSIGTTLYHVAIIEADWLFYDLLGVHLDASPLAWLFPFDDRDDGGVLTDVTDLSLEEHLDRLERVRATLVSEIGPMSLEDFLAVHARDRYDVSEVWVMHHLLQHEAEHRAELGWLKRHAG